MKRSLRLRVIVWVIALLLPASMAAGWLLVRVFAERLVRDIDIAIEEEADTVAAMLAKSAAPEGMRGLLQRIAAETDTGAGKMIVVVRNGRLLDEIPDGAQAELRSNPGGRRIASRRAGVGSEIVEVTIAARADAALHATQRLTLLLLIGIPAGLLLLSAGLWLVIGRALRPLAQASDQLEALAVATLSTRVHIDNPDDEVGRMVTVLNRMLDRVEANVTQLQRFSAHAAHELRTPLAVLRTGLDLALSRQRTAADYRAALNEAHASTERLCRLAEDLLTLARLEAQPEMRATARLDLSEVLQELADAWADAAATRGVTIAVETSGALPLLGNAGDLYRLFSNLLDNAIRHSPTHGSVQLRAAGSSAGIQVSVADEGVGVPAAELAQVFEPFYRATILPGTTSGAGLGLSIAKGIARAHGGIIEIANRPQGGCVVSVRFPVGGPF